MLLFSYVYACRQVNMTGHYNPIKSRVCSMYYCVLVITTDLSDNEIICINVSELNMHTCK